eukprot:TRINITY_DN22196_c0_g3_i3.p1 TRINITY_DN22196_c0_g3~~TRINITY_DN22196_c0_g3_i3.p1  ORF type:complete len:394 (-),score=39.66 TRINITY_DN22196_c0_g3_i3:106-1287(-)
MKSCKQNVLKCIKQKQIYMQVGKTTYQAGLQQLMYKNCQSSTRNPPLRFSRLNGGDNSKANELSIAERVGATLSSFVLKNFLIVGLVVALVMGLLFPQTARSFSQGSDFATVLVFVICGACVSMEDVQSVPISAGLYGIISILFVAPFLSYCLFNMGVASPAVGQALMIYACGPTALSTGVSLVQVFGGNVSLALLMVMASNMLATCTLPFWVPFCLNLQQDISITNKMFNPLQQTIKLSKIIVLPLIIGMLIRLPIQDTIDKYRKALSNVNAVCLCTIIWIQIGKCVEQNAGIKLRDGVEGVIFGGIQHGLLLLVNYFFVRLLLFDYEKKIQQATMLVSSQKALQVCVVVLVQLTQANVIQSNPVYLLVPIIAHFVQVYIDSCLVNGWVAAA